jgi:hypothetical protein
MKTRVVKRSLAGVLVGGLTFVVMVSCARFSSDALDRAVVLDEVVLAPRNDPPIRNDFSFRLVGIDGQPVKRERPPFWMDAAPGVLVDPGEHVFAVTLTPVLRPAGYGPQAITFTAVVEAKKRYIISGGETVPRLVEAKTKPNEVSLPTTSVTPPADAPVTPSTRAAGRRIVRRPETETSHLSP